MICCCPHKAPSTSSRAPSSHSISQSHHCQFQIISRIALQAMRMSSPASRLGNKSRLVLPDHQPKGGLRSLHLLLLQLILRLQSSKKQCRHHHHHQFVLLLFQPSKSTRCHRHFPSWSCRQYHPPPPLGMTSNAEYHHIQAPRATRRPRQAWLPQAQAHPAPPKPQQQGATQPHKQIIRRGGTT